KPATLLGFVDRLMVEVHRLGILAAIARNLGLDKQAFMKVVIAAALRPGSQILCAPSEDRCSTLLVLLHGFGAEREEREGRVVADLRHEVDPRKHVAGLLEHRERFYTVFVQERELSLYRIVPAEGEGEVRSLEGRCKLDLIEAVIGQGLTPVRFAL